MKVLVRGPALTRTGYGEHCRFVIRALREIPEIDLHLLPVNWGQSSWVWENSEEREWIDKLVKKTALYTNQTDGHPHYDISVQVTIPNEWQRMAPVNIGVTAGIETTKVSPEWLQKSNDMDKIITISEHSKRTLLETFYEGIDQRTGQKGVLKCVKPVEIVHYPVKAFDSLPELDLNLSTKFNFLTVAQWGPRKNLHSTIQWFVEEFIDNPNVGLVVKTFLKGGSVMDRNAIGSEMQNFLSRYPKRQCKVYFLHGDLKEDEMHSLYKNDSIHALVSLTHGEGFGLPLFEAAYSGLPVLATDWSGHLDFLYKPTKKKNRPHFAKVDYDLKPIPDSAVWPGVLQKDSEWAYPQQGSYKMKLRELYKDYGRFKSQAKKLQKWVLENFEQQKQYDKLKNFIISEDELNLEMWLENLDSEVFE